MEHMKTEFEAARESLSLLETAHFIRVLGKMIICGDTGD
jgi:hypothetical protein